MTGQNDKLDKLIDGTLNLIDLAGSERINASNA